MQFLKRKTPESASEPKAAPENSPARLIEEQKVTLLACILGAVASIGGFMFGYVSGQISGYFDMEDFARRFGEANGTGKYIFTAARQGTIVGLLPAGSLFGSLIAGRIADTWGRRLAISVSALFTCVGVIIEISAHDSWVQYAIGRLVNGFGIGSLSVCVPMYQSESSPAIIRGVLISCYQLFITLGIWTAEMVNYGTHAAYDNSAQWRIPTGISFLWALLLGVGILALPESPRFAYRVGREEEARHTIAKLAGVDINAPSVNFQIDEIQEKLKEEREGAETRWYEIFTGPRMLYRTIIGMVLQAGQQLTGANFFFYYGTTIFRATGISDSYVTQIILGSVNVACTIAGLWVVKNCGRRNALMTGAAWMMVCFLVYSFVGHFVLDSTSPQNTPQAGAVLIAFSCLFIAAFATTWGPLVWTVVAELYPARYRAPAMAVATASNWFWNFMLSFFTRFITDAIGYLYGLVFAGCCAVLVLVVFFFVVESKDRTLEEIDTMYLKRVNPITSHKWQATSGEKAPSTSGSESHHAEGDDATMA
ncbi:general substrate transporter [Cercophora newfieldiana]|uniref:General substrate transporter n=1 Tax=Cercophora newfieldiana TaxID=92897 RepID=A0AA39YET7_9PEZI|nr:general substrate transporter [Cercophora newfieldiana]